ncbi:flagellar biosynthesis protein FlhB [Candidatus Contubernalis alkaliaceticus]|uniref:flagellar biosynthesis protein FlhB n=1 Tax=Candidatus Contubernalis alkaliaceticus TaxID=338645 RepID=UPI001F4BF19B|nr:flagellar biosynthesis protein FlhB [Candidatus Contubernalis alkalaceticus]UNC91760.1 flagellar biosynthesis protein FlhB [Candidatus Contubernalis alkalaceticus]
MSDSQSQGEKTEQPTPHRLQEARKKGQVVKSTELNSAFTLMIMVLFFMLFGDVLFGWHVDMLTSFLTDGLSMTVSFANFNSLFINAMLNFFKLISPILIVGLVAGLLINYAQVGFLVTSEVLSPKFDKLNPLEGIKKIISRRALFELFKALFKISLVGLVTYLFINSRFEGFLSFLYTMPEGFFAGFSSLALSLGLQVAVVFLIMAVLDYIYQRQEFMKSMRMTKQDVKEEYKQMEGDPLIKSKLKEKQRAMVNQRMMQEVPTSTVVVTNPTELAIALRYDQGEDGRGVPRVVAKGAALIAVRIKKVAKEHRVPVVENRPVARFLYQHVDIGEEIPAELYQAVAEILALVYKLKGR